jgi:ABC-2 type transport system ATP-binding protein
VNGLDPEGIRWVRNLLKELAREGHTVFLSSHMMSEMALTAEHLIVVGRGRLIADMSVEDFVHKASSGAVVRVRTPDVIDLRGQLIQAGATVDEPEHGVLEIHGSTSEQIGELAKTAGVTLHELTQQQVSLEDAFMRFTRDAVEYHASTPEQRLEVLV